MRLNGRIEKLLPSHRGEEVSSQHKQAERNRWQRCYNSVVVRKGVVSYFQSFPWRINDCITVGRGAVICLRGVCVMGESVLPAFLEVRETVSIDAAKCARPKLFTNVRDERSNRELEPCAAQPTFHTRYLTMRFTILLILHPGKAHTTW